MISRVNIIILRRFVWYKSYINYISFIKIFTEDRMIRTISSRSDVFVSYGYFFADLVHICGYTWLISKLHVFVYSSKHESKYSRYPRFMIWFIHDSKHGWSLCFIICYKYINKREWILTSPVSVFPPGSWCVRWTGWYFQKSSFTDATIAEWTVEWQLGIREGLNKSISNWRRRMRRVMPQTNHGKLSLKTVSFLAIEFAHLEWSPGARQA